MKAALSLIRRLDQQLLLNYPELWLLRLPLVHVWAGILLLLSLPVALAQPRVDALPDPSTLRWQMYLITVPASLGWMYLQHRDNKSRPFRARARWYPRVLGFWYCLMVINAPAVLSSWMMLERIAHFVDPITLERETALIRELRACLDKTSYETAEADCPEIQDRYGTILLKYGFNNDQGGSPSYSFMSLKMFDGLSKVEARMGTLRSFHQKQAGTLDTGTTEASPSFVRTTSWNLAVVTLFAALFVFLGGGQWASFMWFLGPILVYLSPIVLQGAGFNDPAVSVVLFGLVLVASALYVSRARRKSPALAAAWGILNFSYLSALILISPNVIALLLYAATAPALQDRQDRLRALPF